MMTITPEPGNEQWIAQMLLGLADSPYQVQMTTHPRRGFRVPQELYDKFVAAVDSTPTALEAVEVGSAPEAVGVEPAPEVETADEEPSKPRRGRPKKIQGGQ